MTGRNLSNDLEKLFDVKTIDILINCDFRLVLPCELKTACSLLFTYVNQFIFDSQMEEIVKEITRKTNNVAEVYKLSGSRILKISFLSISGAGKFFRRNFPFRMIFSSDTYS